MPLPGNTKGFLGGSDIQLRTEMKRCSKGNRKSMPCSSASIWRNEWEQLLQGTMGDLLLETP